MKILYISSEYHPTEIAVSIRSKFNVAALRAEGHEVTVLSSGPTRTGPKGELVEGIGSGLASNSDGLKKRLLGELKVGYKIACFVCKNRAKFDRFIVTSPPFFSLIIISVLLRLLRLPYIVDVRDRYPQTLFSLGIISNASLIGRLLTFVEKYIYTGALAVVTVTTELQCRIHGDTGVIVHLEQNGFDEALFFPGGKELSEDRPVTIIQHGLFGNLFDEENLAKIANYCAKHAANHQFILVGYGKKLEIVRARNLPNIRILPQQSQKEIAGLLQEADIGMACMVENDNTLTGIPVKVFEYIGAGLPVLHSPLGITGKIIREGELGFAFAVDDWGAAARWLVEVIDSRAARLEYAKRVRSSRYHYSRQSQSKRFAEFVSGL